MQHNKEAGIILAFGLAAAFVPALLMGDPFAALQFSLAFTLLFILPLTPWVLLVDANPFERLALALVLGISGIPIAYFFIGVFHVPMTLWTFLLVPLLVFAAGFFALKRKGRNHNNRVAAHQDAQNAPADAVQRTVEVAPEEKK